VFAAQNPGIYSDLNEYGFPRESWIMRRRGVPASAGVEELAAQAKAAIVANAQFTGVTDSSTLELASYDLSELRESITCRFGPQIYEGLMVLYTHIYATIDSVGTLALDGNYHREICIPESAAVSAAEAQASILGLEIVYYVGVNRSRTFVVTAESFGGEPYKVIFSHELPGAIELRVAWLVPVGPAGQTWWYVYVDTMDGELIEVEQHVHF
jgi:hypothetical protein